MPPGQAEAAVGTLPDGRLFVQQARVGRRNDGAGKVRVEKSTPETMPRNSPLRAARCHSQGLPRTEGGHVRGGAQTAGADPSATLTAQSDRR